MTNLLAFAGTDHADGQAVRAGGRGRIAYVDPRDVAAAAAAALTDGRPRGPHVHADRARGRSPTTQIAAGALRRPPAAGSSTSTSPATAARQAMLEAGLPAIVADAIVDVYASYRAGSMTRTTGGVRALTGREPGTFARFARDHAALFGAGEVVLESA